MVPYLFYLTYSSHHILLIKYEGGGDVAVVGGSCRCNERGADEPLLVHIWAGTAGSLAGRYVRPDRRVTNVVRTCILTHARMHACTHARTHTHARMDARSDTLTSSGGKNLRNGNNQRNGSDCGFHCSSSLGTCLLHQTLVLLQETCC